MVQLYYALQDAFWVLNIAVENPFEMDVLMGQLSINGSFPITHKLEATKSWVAGQGVNKYNDGILTSICNIFR